MSQTQFIRRKCDFCGEKQDFDMGGLSPEQEKAMSNWFTLAREFIINGQPVPVVKHACKQSCAANILSTNGLEAPQLPGQQTAGVA